jgi:hypothetical protein
MNQHDCSAITPECRASIRPMADPKTRFHPEDVPCLNARSTHCGRFARRDHAPVHLAGIFCDPVGPATSMQRRRSRSAARRGSRWWHKMPKRVRIFGGMYWSLVTRLLTLSARNPVAVRENSLRRQEPAGRFEETSCLGVFVVETGGLTATAIAGNSNRVFSPQRHQDTKFRSARSGADSCFPSHKFRGGAGLARRPEPGRLIPLAPADL